MNNKEDQDVDNIKMDLGEIAWGGLDWLDLAEDIDQWPTFCGHGNELLCSIRCWGISSCTTGGYK
jgi:hypothetical protein